MTEVDIPPEVVWALVRMSPRPQKELAKAIEMDPGNFSTALKGLRALPSPHLKLLLRELGIGAAGQLRRDRVHLWELGLRVAPLRTATDYLFPHGADFAGVWREGGGLHDLRRICDDPLIAVLDGDTRVIVRTRPAWLLENPDPLTPETVPALRRRLTPPDGQSRALSIPSGRFRDWESGQVTPEEFDRLLSTARPATARRPRTR